MKRLQDEPPSGRVTETRLRDLLESVDPLGERPRTKASVWARLPVDAPAPPPVLTPLRIMIGMAVVVVAVVAAALLVRHSKRSPSHAPSVLPSTAPSAASPGSLQTPAPIAKPSAAQDARTALTTGANESAAKPPTPSAPTRTANHRAARSAEIDPAERVREDSASVLEAAVVVDAIRALRRDHDPERAATLLEFYLRRHPDGPIAEEALALAIEAAIARGDGTSSALAGEYLRRYPEGRYAPLARGGLRH